MGDGYRVYLKPLAVGNHTIEFRGVAVFPDGFKFEVGVHHKIKVVPSFSR